MACLGPGFFLQEALLLTALVSRGVTRLHLVTIDATMKDFADWLRGEERGATENARPVAQQRLRWMHAYLRRVVSVMDLVR